MNKKILYTASTIALGVPFVTCAASRTLSDLTYKIIGYLNQALVLLMGVAILIFVWNVIKYFIRADEDHKEAAPYVMWSVIGFFVILSFWGLVNILQGTFGLQNSINKPTSWSDLSNLFPTGGGSSSGSDNVFNGSYTQVTNNGQSGSPSLYTGSVSAPASVNTNNLYYGTVGGLKTGTTNIPGTLIPAGQ